MRGTRYASMLVLGLLLLVAFSVTAAPEYSEAPALTQLVNDGQLPKVGDRLPENPMIVEPLEEIGQYGGTWRLTIHGPSSYWVAHVRHLYEPLVRWEPDFSGVKPNLAESYEVSDDATVFTFYLRKGVKWSDGAPFTADDIGFVVNNIFGNKDLYPGGVPAWLTVNGIPAKFKKIDDFTCQFIFEQPNSMFLWHLASTSGSTFVKPAHYLKQFHPDFAGKEAVHQMAGSGAYSTWVELFNSKDDYQNVDRPSLEAWVLTKPIGAGTQAAFRRNPYYWKVDPKGQQLPYLDEVVFEVVDSADVIKLKAMAGEIDFQHEKIGDTIEMFSLLHENMERGDYRLVNVEFAHSNQMLLFPNYNHKDPTLREIFHNKDFRFGLSHAINREEITELVLFGIAEPRQNAPNPDSVYYHPELESVAIEYDPDKANEYLDKAGLDKRDAQGFRTKPDGSRLELNVELSNTRPVWIDMMELVQRDLEKVGLRVNINLHDRNLFDERVNALEHDLAVWSDSAGSGAQVLLYPKFFLPHDEGSLHMLGYTRWFNTGGVLGEKPEDEDIIKTRELYDQIVTTVDEEKQIELMRQILDLNAENLWTIGISSFPRQLAIVKNDFRNVPTTILESWVYPTPGPTNPETYFWKR